MTTGSKQALIWSHLDPSMLTGVASIDKEHDALILQLGRLTENPDALPDSEVFLEVLGRLGTQINGHFQNEERFIKSCGMPASKVAEHVEAHSRILEQYAQLHIDLMQGATLARAEVLLMIQNWIIDHLLRHDLEIRKHLSTVH